MANQNYIKYIVSPVQHSNSIPFVNHVSITLTIIHETIKFIIFAAQPPLFNDEAVIVNDVVPPPVVEENEEAESYNMCVAAAADLDIPLFPIVIVTELPRRFTKAMHVILFTDGEWELVRLYDCQVANTWRFCIVATGEYGQAVLDVDYYGKDNASVAKWLMLTKRN